jgi:transposase-like protein
LPFTSRTAPQPHMANHTPQFKHNILMEYVAGSRTHGFAALARRYGIPGGASTLSKWYSHWDSTPHSLERREGSGSRTLLTPEQVQRYIVRPIRRKNQEHVAISYPELKENIEEKIGHSISVRSIRRHGREEGGIRYGTTQPRTEQERKCVYNIGDHKSPMFIPILTFKFCCYFSSKF